MAKAQESTGALSGLKVVDICTVVAGPICTQMFADNGANVIKIEPPIGDESRRMGPPVYRDGMSPHFTGLNRNKRGIALDLNKPEAREVLLKLLEDADILAVNFKPGTLEKWGLGYEDFLKERFPRLIVCQVTGFGGTGPLGKLPGYDPVAQGFAGIISLNGEEGGNPLRVNLNVCDVVTGLYAGSAMMMALYERSRSGRGQEINVCLLDSALTLLHPFAANYLMMGAKPMRMGSRHPAAAPYDVYPTKDGHILVCAVTLKHFQAMCDMLGVPDLAKDPRLATSQDRVKHMDMLTKIMKPLFAKYEKSDLAVRLLTAGVPAAPVLEIPEVMAHPQVAAREMVLSAPDGYKAIGMPIKMSRTPGKLRRMPPTFGEHNREVLKEAGFDDQAIDTLIKGGVVMVEQRKG